MVPEPVPALVLPGPAKAPNAPAPASAQTANPTTAEQQQPTASPQKHQPPHQPQQQHVTANHPASIAAAATVALSATLLDPNEWNALASTSMVTLDDLTTAFLEQREQQLKDLEATHRQCLRELLFMSENYDKADVAGSPWKLGQSMEVAEDDARDHIKAFLDRYRLSLDNPNSIKDQDLEQPKALRDLVSRELKTGPVELAPPPTPTSATAPAAGDPQRDRDRQKELDYSNKAALHRSQAVARAAAAVQARAIAEGVAKIKPLTITTAESQGVRVAPLQPGQVPSFVIESSTPIAPLSAPTAVSTTASSDRQTDLQVTTTAEPGIDGATPAALKVESPGKTVSSPSKAPNALENAVSPVPGLARNASTHSSGAPIPPSPTVVPSLPNRYTEPPLHPTLQVLAPNPVSVTYAASLRPLPPDPTRRITGAGVGGGAIHHRSGRKISSLASHSNVNSYSSIAAAKIGPAGSGQADLYRWYVRARASPGAGMVGKADKCLTTSDWKVAFNEQRFVRAMARIEKLKAQGEWSFRQPKKQKGPVVRKAHWDHLLEEMKWLQTDFREERRWKMTVAFHIAHEVAAWHRAGTAAERAAFCVSAQRPYRRRTVSDNVEPQTSSQEIAQEAELAQGPLVSATTATVDDEMPDANTSAPMQNTELPAPEQKAEEEQSEDVDVTMEGEGEADAAVTEAVNDALETTNETASAPVEEMDADGEEDDADADADDVEAATAALVSGEPAKPPQVEVVREPLAQPEPMPTLSVSSQPTAPPAIPADLTTEETQSSANKLANALRSETRDTESTLTTELPPQLLATLRAPIFSTNVTTTVVSPAALLESLDPEAAAALLGIEIGDLTNAADLLEPGSLSFSKMFPELPLYGGVSLPDPNSKSDRRWDEGSLNQPPRLTHVTKLLDSRPLLVSTLEPSKNRANGRWLPDSDWVVAAEQSDPLRGITDGADAGLPPMPGSVLFARKNNRAAKETTNAASTTPAEPAQPDARAALFTWTPDEDNYLMTLAKQYHNNWSLVADLFNSTRLNTATDRREAWDCYDRCRRIQQAADEGKPPPGPPQLPSSAAETEKDKDKDKKGDGKESADGSSSKKDKLNKKLGSKYDGSKRKLRRSNLMEVMRKSAKRREASKQAQQTQQTKKVNLNTHETHAQIKAGPAITPQSLSALKAERDQAALRQYYEQQRAQLAYQQQQQQQQRLLAQQAQAQRMAQQQATVATAGQAATPNAQTAKAAAATIPGGANGQGALSLAAGTTPGTQPGQVGQAQQKAPAVQMPTQPTSQPQPQPQAQTQQISQPQQQQQQQQQVQAHMQSQFQASQAAQMQSLYAQVQQQQRQQQQNQQLGQAAGMGQVRPAVGPLTQQQLSSLTPQQQQQYHAQLAAATAAAQQQQLRNQMAAVAAAQQSAQNGTGGVQGLPFQLPNAQAQAQFQLMQQQQQQQQQQQNAMQQNQPRPPNMQTQAQAQAQAAALQMYQQQQRQAAQVQAQAQMRTPQTGQAQQQYGVVRPGAAGVGSVQQRPPPVPTATGQNKSQQQQQQARTPTPTANNGNGAAAPGMPATIQALQQQLAISLATSNLSPEQINGLAIQLYKQAQQQQQQQQQQQAVQGGAASSIGAANQPRPQAGQAANARPPQQVLNQAIQALAAQNQKSQQQAQPGGTAGNAGAASPQARPTPRPS